MTKINKKRLCEIRAAADKVLVTAGYMNVDVDETGRVGKGNVLGGAVDIIKIAHAYGFVAGNASFSDNTLGFIIVNENTNLFTDCNITWVSSNQGSSIDRINQINQIDQLICINNFMTPQYKRYMIAYELGHYILHFDAGADGGWAHVDRPNRPRRDAREADAFAKYLLMPEGSFSAKYHQFNKIENVVLVVPAESAVSEIE